MVDAEYDPEEIEQPVPRTPSMEDLVELCRILNKSDAKYLVIGGFAIISSGYLRVTQDLDFVEDIFDAASVEMMRTVFLLQILHLVNFFNITKVSNIV